MPNNCTGTLSSLNEERVLFTGRAYINGDHVKRDVLRDLAQHIGALVASDQSRKVTVLVLGEMWSGPLHDEDRRYSRKATFVEQVERTTGHHVHVIDIVGFKELLHGRPARCVQLRPPS